MRHLSTLHLHQLRYGELPPDREPEVRRHLADCPRCAQRLAVQERERSAFEVRPVPATLRPAPRRRWWAWGIAGALLAAAAAVTVALPQPIGPDPVVTGIRPKGGPRDGLELWVERGGGARPWRSGEVLRAGDVVQLVVAPEGATVVTVAGLDGTGAFEVYGSFRPDDPHRPAPAPFSLTLDGAPGPQRFFAARADRALADAEMKDAALRDVLPAGAAIAEIVVPKE